MNSRTLATIVLYALASSITSVASWTSNITKIEVYIGHSNNPWGGSSSLKVVNRKERQTRGRRSVVHLYNMVLCATGCNPLAYKGYGCYCGFLGSGNPTDPIDNCCKMHDWCYNYANCPMFLEYFVPYVWTCYKRRPLCGIGMSCGQRLCDCDRRLAECLSRYPCPRTKATLVWMRTYKIPFGKTLLQFKTGF